MKRYQVCSFAIGVFVVLILGLTTDQILQDIHNPIKHSLNVTGNFATNTPTLTPTPTSTPTPVTPPYQLAVAADTPCHWYHMDAPSGVSETDVGNGACETLSNATYANSPTLNATGISGMGTDKAVTFASASSQYMSVHAGPDGYFSPSSNECTTLNQGCSFEQWIKPASSTEDCTPFWGRRVGVNNQWFTALNSNGTMRTVVYQSNCSTVSATTGNVDTYTGGTWKYIVVTTLGAGGGTWTNLKFYGDANLLATVSAFAGTKCGDAQVVQFVAGRDGNNCNGTIDEVAYYNQQLNGTQITDHHAAGLMARNDSWPYIARAPQLPHFRDDNYFSVMVSRGYNTGFFDLLARIPRFFQVGYLPFEKVPPGNTGSRW